MKILFWIFIFCFPVLGYGQDSFENTISFDSKQGSPPATIDDVAWIAGYWVGQAFGGITEEVWTPPLGNSMMCVFKLVADNQVSLYEIVIINEENGSLMLRLKHFDEKLRGWESKNETLDFPLVKIDDSRVYFDAFTFEKVDDDQMNIYVVIDIGGKKTEVKFPYKRKRL